MNESFLNFSGSNPFSTRFTAPGKAPFFFDSAFCDRIRNSHPTKFEAFFNELVGRNGDFRNAICIKLISSRLIPVGGRLSVITVVVNRRCFMFSKMRCSIRDMKFFPGLFTIRRVFFPISSGKNCNFFYKPTLFFCRRNSCCLRR